MEKGTQRVQQTTPGDEMICKDRSADYTERILERKARRLRRTYSRDTRRQRGGIGKISYYT